MSTQTKDAAPLERDDESLQKLRALGIRIPSPGAWLETFGWAKDDPIYDEAMRLAAEWRAEINRKSLEEFDDRDAGS